MSDKRVTINDIARALEISRGTVDRAMHNRGRIDADTREMILAKAEELGYKPNKVGRILASKGTRTITVMMPRLPEFFFAELARGLEEGILLHEEAGFALDCRFTERHDLKAQRAGLKSLLDNPPSGLVIAPAHASELNRYLQELTAAGIPVICINTDAPDSGRLTFIGHDLAASGRTAAEILGKAIRGPAKLGVVTGFPELAAHQERLEGFRRELQESHPRLSLAWVEICRDDPEQAAKLAAEHLRQEKYIAGIFAVSGAATLGLCRALAGFPAGESPMAVGTDYSPEIADYLRTGLLFAALDQDPHAQGYYAIQALYRYWFEDMRDFLSSYHTQVNLLLKNTLSRSIPERNPLYRL